jgi:hypothetical protein
VKVLFRPGRSDLTTAAVGDLAAVAQHLGSRPRLFVEISAEASSADRRWLAEQALRPELEETRGFMGMMRALGMRDARARIRAALAARAIGAPGLLDRSDESLLTRLIAEAPPVRDAQLDALREQRLARVVNHLSGDYGVGSQRIVVRAASPRESATAPTVRVRVTMPPESVPSRGSSSAVSSPAAPPERVD